MFGIGGFELFLILLFGFLIFGPDKLPAMAKTIGKAIAKFRSAQEEMSGVLKGEMVFDKDAEDPFKNPLDALDDMAAKASKGAQPSGLGPLCRNLMVTVSPEEAELPPVLSSELSSELSPELSSLLSRESCEDSCCELS